MATASFSINSLNIENACRSLFYNPDGSVREAGKSRRNILASVNKQQKAKKLLQQKSNHSLTMTNRLPRGTRRVTLNTREDDDFAAKFQNPDGEVFGVGGHDDDDEEAYSDEVERERAYIHQLSANRALDSDVIEDDEEAVALANAMEESIWTFQNQEQGKSPTLLILAHRSISSPVTSSASPSDHDDDDDDNEFDEANEDEFELLSAKQSEHEEEDWSILGSELDIDDANSCSQWTTLTESQKTFRHVVLSNYSPFSAVSLLNVRGENTAIKKEGTVKMESEKKANPQNGKESVEGSCDFEGRYLVEKAEGTNGFNRGNATKNNRTGKNQSRSRRSRHVKS